MAGRRVVLFDLGGVVLESPIVSIRRFSKEHGVEDLNRFLGASQSWAKLERSEILMEQFPEAIYEEAKAKGHKDGISLGVAGWKNLLAVIGGHNMRLTMAVAIRRLREAGFTTAALTNNFISPEQSDPLARIEHKEEQSVLKSLFNYFVESSVIGLRKPDPAFYQEALRIIGCKPEDAIFLDDIGKNLKTASDMGIKTIHVKNETPTMHLEALKQLEELVGIQLVDMSKL